MPKRKSLIGMRFARLTVIGDAPPYQCAGRFFRCSKCRCDCGRIVYVVNSSIKSGNTKSCGCFRKENTRTMKLKHGHSSGGSESKTYKSWSHMIDRCFRKKSDRFKYYGGRGITVCSRWMNFENFLQDVGERPDGTTIERIDNSKGYAPGNVRWATRFEQAQNKRTNRVLTVLGITKCFSEMARYFNIPETRARARLNLGWTIEDSFMKPRSGA